MRREAGREILAFAVLFLTAFRAFSLYSADPADGLLRGFWGRGIHNVGGPIGAFVSAEVQVWMGKSASWGLVAILALVGLGLLFRRGVREPTWKVVGSILFLVSIATFEVALTGSGPSPDSPPGGYYGQFCYGFLISHMERFGAFLMVFFTLLVALLVSTDTLVYPALARAGEIVGDGDRWRSAGSTLARIVPAIKLPRLSSLGSFLRRGNAGAAEEPPRRRKAREKKPEGT